MPSTPVSPYSLPDLKSTTDDALSNYLISLKFIQDHTFTDVRLSLGYVAVAIAGVLFYADWKLGWDVTKAYTLPAVVVYFALNSAFTYWIWFVEKGAIFVGSRDGVKITITSATPKKYEPKYELTVCTQSSPSAQIKEAKITASFTRWFTSDGFFVAKPFQQWLASSIDVVGKADPNNVVEEIGRGSAIEKAKIARAQPQTVNLGSIQDVLQYIESDGATGVQPTPSSKKGRRRG
ncbi:uncharacterized protein PV09_08799 [Verruconis gallopava]|uniref:Signal peptidase complex subunit 2 n=1 Tax=Verruconis gallopava TaxID=253628 RepID=A0A0D2AKI6_9PEZI|nr:uncharacterized protein PV09_08799 [Verruconis gallopava]KIV99493.1 hypothetical protein PV09_08799 [Verruconis gallopava]